MFTLQDTLGVPLRHWVPYRVDRRSYKHRFQPTTMVKLQCQNQLESVDKSLTIEKFNISRTPVKFSWVLGY